MADKTYVTTTAGVNVYVDAPAGRALVNLSMQGAPVPADADPEHVKLLLDRGLIEQGTAEGGLEVDADAPPPFPGTDDKPAKSAPKADWVDYAQAVDPERDPDEIEALTVAELQAQYGG